MLQTKIVNPTEYNAVP